MRVELKLMSRIPVMKVCLLIMMLLTTSASAHKSNSRREETAASDTGNQRSIMLGRLLLVPILATLGIKLLALLPIVFSKLLLLTTLSFLSSNLSLLISVFVGVRNLWLLEEKANVNGHVSEYLHHDHATPQRATEHETQEDSGDKAHAVNSLSSRLDHWPASFKYAEWRQRYLRRAIDTKKKMLTGECFATPGPAHRDPLTGRHKIKLHFLNGRYCEFAMQLYSLYSRIETSPKVSHLRRFLRDSMVSCAFSGRPKNYHCDHIRSRLISIAKRLLGGHRSFVELTPVLSLQEKELSISRCEHAVLMSLFVQYLFLSFRFTFILGESRYVCLFAVVGRVRFWAPRVLQEV